MTGGATAAGSGRPSRPDPYTLPAGISLAAGAAFTIDRERGVVTWPAANGSARSRSVPLDTYAGVAVRVEAGGAAGRVRAYVELLHTDPSLTVPLVVADEPEDVAADWQAWGRALNLPLLVVAPDGTVSAPLVKMGAITLSPTKPRRRHSYFAARRPRFLTRRKTGRRELMARIDGDEIIARN